MRARQVTETQSTDCYVPTS